MANINKRELTKAQIEKAMACKTAEELMAAAKAEGFDITKDEAEAYIAEMADYELDDETLKSAAGGETCWTLKCQKHQTPCPSYCSIAEA